MRRASSHYLLAIALVGLMTIWAPRPAAAAKSKQTAYDSGPSVRRKLLYRSTRLEIAPLLSFTLNDAFVHNGLVGANINYHLTNEFGLGINASYGLIHMNSGLSDNVKAELQKKGQTQVLNSISYSYVNWSADLALSYVPLFGKFSLMNSLIINYDLHLIGGVSVVNEGVETAVPGGIADSKLSGTNPGGVIGGGLRLYVSDMLSINYEVRDYIYNRAQVSRGTANGQLSNNVMMSIGVGIFFPSEVKISR